MAVVSADGNKFKVNAYSGDFKTLLAFDFEDESLAHNLAGFTIACKLPLAQPAFYLFNFLGFEKPAAHAQVASEKPYSTMNAPIQKYRWVDFAHAPESGGALVEGSYGYTVTPRYFDENASMLPMDAGKSVTISIPVGPFASKSLQVGFTRGYMQSQAYARHFGDKTPVQPAKRPLQYDTSGEAGTNNGKSVTYAEIYEWMGATARKHLFDLLAEVQADPSLQLDVFAYDMNEPDLVDAFLKLAGEGRIRMILDSAQLHITHPEKNKTTGVVKTIVPLEDLFDEAFQKAKAGDAELKRGCFARYSHDKIFIVSKKGTSLKDGAPLKVLTGSTNFSVNGLYVNANHVLVFDEPTVAQYYAKVFTESWTDLTSAKVSKAIAAKFATSTLATKAFVNRTPTVPKLNINASPHTETDTERILGAIAARITSEASATNGNVLFAVMQLTGSSSPVYQALAGVHDTQSLYSYGISDSPGGIKLYAPGSKTGVLVTGKPKEVSLPPPFNKVPTPPGHEIHDKFVVCGLNGKDPVVWCGSSNLAMGGESSNGDNLLEIHDADVVTAFAIEALLLVDHYNFLDRYAAPPKATAPKAPATPKAKAKQELAATPLGKRIAAKKAAKKATPKKAVEKEAPRKSASKKAAGRTASLRLASPVARMVAPAKKAAKKAPAKKTATKKTTKRTTPVTQMPQSLEKAAKKAGIFLYTNDQWSLRYFDPNDLHSMERKLFGRS